LGEELTKSHRKITACCEILHRGLRIGLFLVNTVMNLRFPYKTENILTSCLTISFSRRLCSMGLVGLDGWFVKCGKCLLLHIPDCTVTRLITGRSDFDTRHGQGFFSLQHRVQIGSDAHPASYLILTGWRPGA